MIKNILVGLFLTLCNSASFAEDGFGQSTHGAKSSLISISGVVVTQQSQADIQRATTADDAKSKTDEAMVKYAAETAMATIVVSVIALFQLAMFFFQLRLMRQSVDDAKNSAQAARDSADIAKNTFAKLERPWLFLVQSRVVRREGAPINPSLQNNYYVSLIFKNDGRSPAFITGLNFKFIETSNLPEIPDYSLCASQLVTPATLSSGSDFESSQVGPAPGEHVQYTIFGKLTYKDVAGVEHHTGFALDISPNLPAASTNKNFRYDWHD